MGGFKWEEGGHCLLCSWEAARARLLCVSESGQGYMLHVVERLQCPVPGAWLAGGNRWTDRSKGHTHAQLGKWDDSLFRFCADLPGESCYSCLGFPKDVNGGTAKRASLFASAETHPENHDVATFVLQSTVSFWKRRKGLPMQPGTWCGLPEGDRVVFLCVFWRVTGAEAKASHSSRLCGFWINTTSLSPQTSNSGVCLGVGGGKGTTCYSATIQCFSH